jgi:microsomal dipeptidase-like Zn-dependent dipeptidase
MKRIDMHCHPSLKRYLFEKDLRENNDSSKSFSILYPDFVQVDNPKMRKGDINVAIVAHYLPEYKFTTDCKTVKFLLPLLKLVIRGYLDKVEKPDPPDSAFDATICIMDDFESHIMSDVHDDMRIATDYNDMMLKLNDGKRVYLHAIEGANSLGNNHANPQTYLNNLQTFSDRGVCMITIAHLFPNDIASCINSFPPDMRFLLCYKGPTNSQPGLSDIGKRIVEKMLELGIIVDLTHCSFESRDDVYAINNARGVNKRALVFSHVGSNIQHNHPMNPRDKDIIEIVESKGVIGTIFNKFWLTGEYKKFWDFGFDDNGIPDIVKTMESTVKQIETLFPNNPDIHPCDYLAIGSDFDGFVDPLDDIHTHSKFDDLEDAILQSATLKNSINDIFSDNMMRVLRTSWK